MPESRSVLFSYCGREDGCGPLTSHQTSKQSLASTFLPEREMIGQRRAFDAREAFPLDVVNNIRHTINVNTARPAY